jgi:hypothetical protein
MKIDEAIERALRSAEPVFGLRAFAGDLLAQGMSREEVLSALEAVRRRLREGGRDADEDAVMDVMDFVVGWCSPHMRLDPPEKRGGADSPPPTPGPAPTNVPEEGTRR